MTSTTYFYSCDEYESEARHQHKVQGSWSLADSWDCRMLAQEAADDYHSNHDAWEAPWPLVFALYGSEDGEEVARFSVDRELQYRFTASAQT